MIVVAVGIDLTIGHPTEAASTADAAVILGGPGLYLGGNALFKHALAGRVSWLRLAGIVALALLAPVAIVANRLVLSAAATLVVAALAATTRMRPGR